MTKAMTSTFDLSLLLHAAAAETGHFVTGDVRWMPAAPDDLRVLTESDRELLEVVTGERFGRDTAPGKPGAEPNEPNEPTEPTEPTEATEPAPASFLAWQLICDRRTGALTGPVTVPYVESLFTDYEMCVDGNPMSDDIFDLALAYLVGRDLRVDPTVIWV